MSNSYMIVICDMTRNFIAIKKFCLNEVRYRSQTSMYFEIIFNLLIYFQEFKAWYQISCFEYSYLFNTQMRYSQDADFRTVVAPGVASQRKRAFHISWNSKSRFSQSSRKWQYWHQMPYYVKTKNSAMKWYPSEWLNLRPQTFRSNALLSEPLRHVLLGRCKLSVWSCSVGSN